VSERPANFAILSQLLQVLVKGNFSNYRNAVWEDLAESSLNLT
jgi:hypothetical protein